jgi:ribosomal protein L19E
MSDDSEFLRRRLDAIQTELRVIRDTADIDRRNVRSFYDNLATEMSRKLAAIDHKLELAAERFEARMDRIEEMIQKGRA